MLAPLAPSFNSAGQVVLPVARAAVPTNTLGPWELVRVVGEGSWCHVHQARPSRSPFGTPADYAIKVLKPEFEHDAHAIAMLTREANVGSRVSHPHLMPVLAGHLRAAPYYVALPFVDGSTLRDLLLSGQPLETPRALWIVRQAAEALVGLHDHGLAHGDVKPSNILVARTGHVTLFDLGFARRIYEPAEPHGDDLAVDPFMATPAYAAPELFLDHAARDPRSDCYSLGITLFEMLTGQLPFTDSTLVELAAAHLHRRPPEPRQLAPHLAPRLVRFLKRLLAKDALRRPSSTEVVATLVELEIDTFDERGMA